MAGGRLLDWLWLSVMWTLLNGAKTVRFRARIYAAFPQHGCDSGWSELIRGHEWSVEAAWPNFLRIEKLRRTEHDPDELSLAVAGDLVISDGTQLLELDFVRSLFVTAPAPKSLEDLKTRMGLHAWFAPELLFAGNPFAKLERCEEPGPKVSGVHVYWLKYHPSHVLRLNAATAWPHSFSEYRIDKQEGAAEVTRIEFYGWQLDAELPPFVYEG